MNMFLKWMIVILLVSSSQFAFSQQLMRDNLGSHIATKNLNLSGFNINAALNITATGTVNAATVISPVVLAGTATTVSNSSIALQVDGVDKAILVPRVTDLLNATTPSIPLANTVNGMIVYNVATAKFYYRQNNAWVVYVDAINYVDRFVPQVILGLKTMKSDSGFVATGTYVGSTATVPTPIIGAGTRMMWYPAKAAFRAGIVIGSEWDQANIGPNSTAFGYATVASGSSAFAAGASNTSSGSNSTALGNSNSAGGTNTFAAGYGNSSVGSETIAMGNSNFSNSNQSVAMGLTCTATGVQSVAMGNTSQATAPTAFAMGQTALASGISSVALGNQVTASGTNSVAIGNNSTATGQGSIAIGSNLRSTTFGVVMLGDANANLITPEGDSQMLARFAGGYVFYTRADKGTVSRLGAGSNSWSTSSDKRKKENFETIDAESFLLKIDTMKVGSWNYKTQDAKTWRHYGPMAQDFFGAFGKDSYGTIGCDTLIASGDFDGVNMIAIKGLVKRTRLLSQENDALKVRVSALEAKNIVDISTLRDKNEKLSEKLLEQGNNNLKMQEALTKLQKLMENIVAFTPQQAKEAGVVDRSEK